MKNTLHFTNYIMLIFNILYTYCCKVSLQFVKFCKPTLQEVFVNLLYKDKRFKVLIINALSVFPVNCLQYFTKVYKTSQ